MKIDWVLLSERAEVWDLSGRAVAAGWHNFTALKSTREEAIKELARVIEAGTEGIEEIAGVGV